MATRDVGDTGGAGAVGVVDVIQAFTTAAHALDVAMEVERAPAGLRLAARRA